MTYIGDILWWKLKCQKSLLLYSVKVPLLNKHFNPWPWNLCNSSSHITVLEYFGEKDRVYQELVCAEMGHLPHWRELKIPALSDRLTLTSVYINMRNGYSEAKSTRLVLQVAWVLDPQLVNTKKIVTHKCYEHILYHSSVWVHAESAKEKNITERGRGGKNAKQKVGKSIDVSQQGFKDWNLLFYTSKNIS